MAGSTHCPQVHVPGCPQVQGPELWITYHQASRTHKPVTAQLIDISNAAHLFDLEDVLDHVFQQGFVDAKWRSVSYWEDCTSLRLKATTTVQDLLAAVPEAAPRPRCISSSRIRLDVPHFKCERLAHLTNHIFAKGYLPCKARSLVSWKAACGKQIEESVKVEEVFSWGEGLCESKPLCLVIGEDLHNSSVSR
ncbi:hypothetical protein BC826DRAFT_967680 [Russula brevipes]|nr:hypothetical protein BC826DRAFT_967680 [Russula brevipes]